MATAKTKRNPASKKPASKKAASKSDPAPAVEGEVVEESTAPEAQAAVVALLEGISPDGLTTTPEVLQAVIVARIEKASKFVAELTIENQDEYTVAEEALKLLHGLIKQVDQATDNAKTPYYRIYQEAMNLGKSFSNPLTELKRTVSSKMGQYDAKVEAERQAVLRKAEEKQRAAKAAADAKAAEDHKATVAAAIENGELPPDEPVVVGPDELAPPPPVAVMTARTTSSGTAKIVTTKHELVPGSVVPMEYCKTVPDPDKIKAAVDAGTFKPEGDGPTTHGGWLRVWIERGVRSTGRG